MFFPKCSLVRLVTSLSIVVCNSICRNLVAAECPDYTQWCAQRHGPLSSGKYQLAYQRPNQTCRAFAVPEVDQTIKDMRGVVSDPDLFRLFENAFPNTLDTTVSWKGFANNTDEELAFIITGDILAMWLRDSANQMRSYKSVLKDSNDPNSLASLFRGAINLQARYIITSPYCNSFQPPMESGLGPQNNRAAATDKVEPPYDKNFVFECKYELDSLAAFLQISYDYHERTQDEDFFGRYQWVQAVRTIMDVARGLLVGTYTDDGHVNKSPYTFQRKANSPTETLMNGGMGSPVKSGTGLVRSAFRPSDDSAMYELFIPANMQFSSYLGRCASIMDSFDRPLAQEMKNLSDIVRNGIETHGKISDSTHGTIYAYEIDGFGSVNMMDDANVPSLLSAPIIEYLDYNDETYQNTRKYVLSNANSYYMRGSVINGIGGPHVGPGMAWPMSIIVALLSSEDDREIISGLQQLVSSTNGLGLIHESINTFDAADYTRPWFAWANGLFGEMMLRLKRDKPEILQRSLQGAAYPVVQLP